MKSSDASLRLTCIVRMGAIRHPGSNVGLPRSFWRSCISSAVLLNWPLYGSAVTTPSIESDNTMSGSPLTGICCNENITVPCGRAVLDKIYALYAHELDSGVLRPSIRRLVWHIDARCQGAGWFGSSSSARGAFLLRRGYWRGSHTARFTLDRLTGSRSSIDPLGITLAQWWQSAQGV
jgi:hypothetical protein